MFASPSPESPPAVITELSEGTLNSPSLITREQALRAYAESFRDRAISELREESTVRDLKSTLRATLNEFAQALVREMTALGPDRLDGEQLDEMKSQLNITDSVVDKIFNDAMIKIVMLDDFHPQYLFGGSGLRQWEEVKSKLKSAGISFDVQRCDELFLKLISLNNPLCANIHQVALDAGTVDVFKSEDGAIEVARRTFGSRQGYEVFRSARQNLAIETSLELFDELNQFNGLMEAEDASLLRDIMQKFLRGATKIFQEFQVRCNELGIDSLLDRAFPK